MTDVPEHVTESAHWWRDNNARYWESRRILLGWVNDNGPIRLDDGRLLGHQPDGNAWLDEEVAAVMPALITAAEVTFKGKLPDIERVLSLVLEEVPGLDFTVARKVDAHAANAVIRGGGEAGEKLLPFRVQRTKLGIK